MTAPAWAAATGSVVRSSAVASPGVTWVTAVSSAVGLDAGMNVRV